MTGEKGVSLRSPGERGCFFKGMSGEDITGIGTIIAPFILFIAALYSSRNCTHLSFWTCTVSQSILAPALPLALRFVSPVGEIVGRILLAEGLAGFGAQLISGRVVLILVISHQPPPWYNLTIDLNVNVTTGKRLVV